MLRRRSSKRLIRQAHLDYRNLLITAHLSLLLYTQTLSLFYSQPAFAPIPTEHTVIGHKIACFHTRAATRSSWLQPRSMKPSLLSAWMILVGQFRSCGPTRTSTPMARPASSYPVRRWRLRRWSGMLSRGLPPYTLRNHVFGEKICLMMTEFRIMSTEYRGASCWSALLRV